MTLMMIGHRFRGAVASLLLAQRATLQQPVKRAKGILSAALSAAAAGAAQRGVTMRAIKNSCKTNTLSQVCYNSMNAGIRTFIKLSPGPRRAMHTTSPQHAKLKWEVFQRRRGLGDWKKTNTRRRGALISHLKALKRPPKDWPLLLRPVIIVPASAFILYILSRIERVPVTARLRIRFFPRWLTDFYNAFVEQSLIDDMEEEVYDENTYEVQLVCKIVANLVAAHGNFMASAEDSRLIEGYRQDGTVDLTVVVIKSDVRNAFCTGGGHIIVTSGLMEEVGYDEDKLAIILSHELGHYFADHIAETYGFMFLDMVVRKFAQLFMNIGKSEFWSMVDNFLIQLPHSRKQEKEADYIGLVIFAHACYNLKAAEAIWPLFLKMEASHLARESGREEATEEDYETVRQMDTATVYFSDHPSMQERSERYHPESEWMQEAKRIQDKCCVFEKPAEHKRNFLDFLKGY